MEQRKIIMDCDPGIDDAMALAYAASRPDVFKILAVTTVAGNQELQKVTANALDLTAFYGLDTEVAAGMSQPLINKLAPATDYHGDFRWRRLSMHAKVVLSVSAALIVAGALIIKLTENISWLGAFFTSVSARTAGFASYPLGEFSNAGLMAVEVLMFIGASPGSTGGGIKTSTLFALLIGVKAAATNQSEKAFRYSMPVEAFRKAAIIAFVGLCVVVTGTYALSALEPGLDMRDALFEVVSAFTGITGGLSTGSKLLSIAIMFIGRIGPLTIITLWYFSNGKNARFPYGNIAIG